MKLSEDDKLLLVEGRLKEGISISKILRAGKYPLIERPSRIGRLRREIKEALKILEAL
jgi:hypothetical protein